MYTKPQTAMEDLSYDFDVRGDYALFIEEKHFTSDDDLDEETKNEFLNCEATFFRVIHNGEQQSGHGWIENGEIVQWG
jgi:hypothetical protein